MTRNTAVRRGRRWVALHARACTGASLRGIREGRTRRKDVGGGGSSREGRGRAEGWGHGQANANRGRRRHRGVRRVGFGAKGNMAEAGKEGVAQVADGMAAVASIHGLEGTNEAVDVGVEYGGHGSSDQKGGQPGEEGRKAVAGWLVRGFVERRRARSFLSADGLDGGAGDKMERDRRAARGQCWAGALPRRALRAARATRGGQWPVAGPRRATGQCGSVPHRRTAMRLGQHQGAAAGGLAGPGTPQHGCTVAPRSVRRAGRSAIVPDARVRCPGAAQTPETPPGTGPNWCRAGGRTPLFLAVLGTARVRGDPPHTTLLAVAAPACWPTTSAVAGQCRPQSRSPPCAPLSASIGTRAILTSSCRSTASCASHLPRVAPRSWEPAAARFGCGPDMRRGSWAPAFGLGCWYFSSSGRALCGLLR